MPSDPLILAIDTSAAHCAAALLSGGRIVASRHEDMARGQAERLFPLVEATLRDAGASWGDVSVIGVGTGPGNFTGLRIAVSAGRGLALSLGIPVLGVSRFEAQAEGTPRPVLSLVPAPRDQVYLQRLDREQAEAPRLLPADEARTLAECATAPVVGAPFGREPAHRLIDGVALVAARRAKAGGDHERPVPLYVRPADAAPAREAAPSLLP